MKERYALDTGVISLFLSGNKELKWLAEQIDDGNALTTRLNLIELTTLIARKAGWDAAKTYYNRITATNLSIVDTYEEITLSASRLKLLYPELSIVDTVIAAVSEHTHATLLTTEETLPRLKDIKVKKVNY